MNFDPGSFAKFDSHSSRFADDVLRKMRFQGSLTEDDQVLEVGCGTGRFARLFLLTHYQPCRRLVATDCDADMVDFARQHFAHERIVHDILDITTPNLTPFLETYGKFDRIVSFMVFHMIRDQKTAYENIGKLLDDNGECLVVAMSSLDTMDVWLEVYKRPKWKSLIPVLKVYYTIMDPKHEDFEKFRPIVLDCVQPFTENYQDPRNIFNASINYNHLKSVTQVEAEVRDTIRGTGLQCISCEVHDSSWKFDSMDSLLVDQCGYGTTMLEGLVDVLPSKSNVKSIGILLTIFPFKNFVPTEEWGGFHDLWAELMHRQLSPKQGEPLALKFTYYVVHARRSGN